MIKYINTHKNPWMINSLAAIAGEIIFSDTKYIEETKKLIASERARMCETLKKSGKYKVYPASANFMLARILSDDLTSGQIFDIAIRRKMMIRDCSTFPFLDDKYLRFCVMNPEMNTRLLDCLTSV